ncbi:hypothetical protein C1X98_16445 [Pseudomonas sp. FW306-2-11BA]|nr:hypothetical protein C1Y01_27430 [Pseudomonas sp. FW306-02-H05-BA]PNB14820.1 hypothetical protein C1X98_16445 [Pseudomonas sp. FW306-2-11BA]PNB31174.1 hypothetical protein C1Y02_14410 [Pseudomonas sp. FW306-02-F04-AA]
MWRGGLLPLDRKAVPKSANAFITGKCIDWLAIASQSSGSKLPRHSAVFSCRSEHLSSRRFLSACGRSRHGHL